MPDMMEVYYVLTIQLFIVVVYVGVFYYWHRAEIKSWFSSNQHDARVIFNSGPTCVIILVERVVVCKLVINLRVLSFIH